MTDTLLFKRELNLNCAAFGVHAVCFGVLWLTAGADERSFFWHFTIAFGNIVNGVLPVVQTYQFERLAKASAKLRAGKHEKKVSELASTSHRLSSVPGAATPLSNVTQLLSVPDLLHTLLNHPTGYTSFRKFLDREFSTGACVRRACVVCVVSCRVVSWRV